MAVDGTPEAPIAATRVEPAAVSSAAAAPGPAAAAAPDVAAAAPAIIEQAAPVVAEAAIELVAERPSLLETLGKDKPAADKPVVEAVKPEAASDKPKEEAVKPAEAKPAEAPKPVEAAKPEGEPKPVEAEAAKPEPLAPIEYAYELPATLKMDDALKGDLSTALDAFRADPIKGVQSLIDLHAKTMSDYATQLQTDTLRNQHKAFNDTRSGWNTEWMADPEIGGAGYQTATKAIARMRDMFLSDELPGSPKYQADAAAFESFLRITGAGDHPAFGRFLHNVARAFDEPALPPPNAKPAPNRGVKPGSQREKLYGPSKQAS